MSGNCRKYWDCTNCGYRLADVVFRDALFTCCPRCEVSLSQFESVCTGCGKLRERIAELERERDAIDERRRESIGKLVEQRDARDAEIRRLREALHEIAELRMPSPEDGRVADPFERMQWVQHVAGYALDAEGSDG